MQTISGTIYFLITFPAYLLGTLFLSYVFFKHIKITHVITWSLIGTLLSVLFSTYGEVCFCVAYSWYMFRINLRSSIFWIFLFMEVNLILVTLQSCIVILARSFSTYHSNLIIVIATILFDLVLATSLIYLILKEQPLIDQLRSVIQEKTKMQKSVILYTGTTSVSLYCFAAMFNLIGVNANVFFNLLLLGIFLLSVIFNIYSLLFILKSYGYYVELTWIKRAEASQRAYYATLNQQQKNTNKLLHDYKNLLASLQLSLQQSSAAISPDTQAILARAQSSLNQAESNKSSFSNIKSDPLKSLLYLKWAQSMNHNIVMNVQTEGIIQPVKSDLGFALIRALGILIDNALEETIRIKQKGFSVLLNASEQGLEVSVINDVGADFNLADLAKKGFTTKGDGHGNGLTIIDELMQQNKNILIKKSLIGRQLDITLFIGE